MAIKEKELAKGGSGFLIQVDRLYNHSKCIIGRMTANGEEMGYTLELPWRDNKRNVSCVPGPATYGAFIRTDGKRGWRIQLEGVPSRTAVQIHVGNYPSDILGCILLGTGYAVNMVTNSRKAMGLLKAAYEKAGSPSAIQVSVSAPPAGAMDVKPGTWDAISRGGFAFA